jgi:HNH endonuclease
MTMGRKNSFLQNINLDEQTGCWNWTGCVNSEGYGKMRFGGKVIGVHRIAAILYLGLDPDSELLVLHRCDNPGCFNPKHLFLGTDADNMRDCASKGRNGNQKKTHCIHGHPLSGFNLYARADGTRECKTCRNANVVKYKIKKEGVLWDSRKRLQ